MGITIDEAIKRLKYLPLPLNTATDKKNHMAVRLSIEALIRVKSDRTHPKRVTQDTLIGETLD